MPGPVVVTKAGKEEIEAAIAAQGKPRKKCNFYYRIIKMKIFGEA
jgi:hypothetical protein